MNLQEFQSLVVNYLDGTARPEEVRRLREMMDQSPALRRLFRRQVMLHRLQVRFLSQRKENQVGPAISWLGLYAGRMSRMAAYLCLLAVVFVQARLSLPSEYNGLMLYVQEGTIEYAEPTPEDFAPVEVTPQSSVKESPSETVLPPEAGLTLKANRGKDASPNED